MNETFLREAGYPLETFPALALAEGIPQFFPSDSVSFLQSMKTTLEKFLVEEVSIGEQEGELYMKTGYVKKIAFETHCFVEVCETTIVASFILVITKKSDPLPGQKREDLGKEFSEEFLDLQREVDKDKEYLLKTYYGESFVGLYSNNTKVCKIKDLD